MCRYIGRKLSLQFDTLRGPSGELNESGFTNTIAARLTFLVYAKLAIDFHEDGVFWCQ
jgi:hypothetical protein